MQQYTTVKHIFQMVYHDIFIVRSFNCFDISDWKHTVRGKRWVVIHKFAVNDDLAKRLRQTPLSEIPDTRSLVNIAIPIHWSTEEFRPGSPFDKFSSILNTNLFKRFDDNAPLRWTILRKDYPIQKAYVALMEFIPLSIPVDGTL